MSFLEHLDELRSRLSRIALAYLVLLGCCWFVSERLLAFLLRPIRAHLVGAGDLVFLSPAEPFLVYMQASAVMALFLAMPYVLWQVWAFVAPGLYPAERRLAVPFLVFGTAFFAAVGAFAYAVAIPVAAAWLIELGRGFRAAITLRSAFQFESRLIVGMGAVFELPIVIFFLSRIGLVTPELLLRHFRSAVLGIAVLAAVITPTGDMLTMVVFGGPMILLYLLGVGVARVFGRRREA
jgi:sec-independent protein translocase protein TatC